jgi:molybdopterin molybdotransferase
MIPIPEKPAPLLSLDAARQILAETVGELTTQRVSVRNASGLRLAADIFSRANLPSGDVSAMDGYAVRWNELIGMDSLPVAFEVRAGDDPGPLPAGSICRIFTGALVPPGADTVIPQEQTVVHPNGRFRLEWLPQGSHVRRQGEVLTEGVRIGIKGDLLTPGRIALLAAAGVGEVPVIPQPRIAVVMTGAELVNPDQQPPKGFIRDSNGPLLEACVNQARFTFVQQLSCTDDLDQTCRVLEQAASVSDLVVTSGGVSVGDFDFVPEAVRQIGGNILFHRVAIKPGKPVLAARLGETWLLGLPGNPVSVLTGWRMFALPLGLALAGNASLLREAPHRAVLTAPLENREKRALLHPGVLNLSGESEIIPLPWKGSHDLAGAASANALIRLGAETYAMAGDTADYYPLYLEGL